MTIAINSTHFKKPAGNDYFQDYLVKIAVSRPEHRFIFITPFAIDSQLKLCQNIMNVISSPLSDNPLFWRLWLDYTLPGIARKHGAAIIINTGGVCSLRIKTPQLLYISDLSYLFSPEFFSKKQLLFFKKNMPAFLLKAKTIVSASAFLTKKILEVYSTDKKKIIGLQPIPGDEYQPVGWKEKEGIKEFYAGGKEYFLFSGEIHARNHLVNLLKGFSFFKKRQKSNMQLIITAQAVPVNDPFTESLKTYKYRQEVRILTGLPANDLAKITAGAYAFIYPALFEGTAIFPLQAMQCEVPVLAGNTGALNEITSDAALYMDPSDFKDIADKMMLVFKDEAKRADLVDRGKSIAQKINKTEMDDLTWGSILKTTGG